MKNSLFPSKKRFAFLCVFASLLVNAVGAAEHVDPSGTWRWEYEWQGETIKDSLRLNLADEGKVIGTFHGRNATKPIENGKIEKDKLSFEFELEFNGVAVDLKFSGTIKQDDIDGNVILSANGEENEFPWNPKRSVQVEDVLGKWQLHMRLAMAMYSNQNLKSPRMEIRRRELTLGKAVASWTSRTSR